MSNTTGGYNFTTSGNVSVSGISTVRPQMINAEDLLDRILMTYPEYRLAKNINHYGYITEVVVGSLSNVLALIVMLGLTHLPICNYMAVLALADLSVFLGPCLIRWLLTKKVDPRNSSTPVCRLLNVTTYWSFSLSAWLLVVMTIDRYIAITFPLKAIRWSTPRRARFIILGVIIVTFLLNSHFFFTLRVHKTLTNKDACLGYEEYTYFLDEVWPWMDAAIYSFVPFFFLIIFNILIIRSHRKSVKVGSSLKQTHTGQSSSAPVRIGRKLTVTLVTVTFTFIAMTAPRTLLTIIRPIVFNFKPTPNSLDFQILADYTLTGSIVNVMMFANHGINFYLYVLTGRRFREQLFNTFKYCCKKRQLRRVQAAPADSTSIGINNRRSCRKRSHSITSTISDTNIRQTDRGDIFALGVISETDKGRQQGRSNASSGTQISTVNKVQSDKGDHNTEVNGLDYNAVSSI